MKTTTISASLVLVLVAGAVTASHSDDDILNDGVEHQICSPAALANAINAVGALGECETADDDWMFRAGNDPAPCIACSNQTILHRQNVPITGGGPVGPVGTPPAANVSYFQTYYRTIGGVPAYCVYVDPVELACANLFGTTAPPLGPVYLVNATVGPFNVPGTSLDVHLQYRWVDANITFCCTAGGGLVDVYYPVDPSSPGDVDWWVQNGNQTSLDLLIEPRFDGNLTGTPVQISIPYVGQALAAAMRTSPNNPFPL